MKGATQPQAPAPGAAPQQQGGQPPGGAKAAVPPPPPTVAAPLPPPPSVSTAAPIAPGAKEPRQLDSFRSQRREVQEGGRTIINEPGRIIVRDPSGQSFVRHNEIDRFRYGARDVQVQQRGGETRTVIVRPDGSQIITTSDRDGRLLRRIRRDSHGREIIIIDDSVRPRPGPGVGGIAAGVAAGVAGAVIGGYYVNLPPPVVRIPQDRYIVEAESADPDLIYETLVAPPVERIDRRYSLDEIRYSPMVRDRMPRIDLDTITFDTGSWEITPDQVQKLAAIAEGLNRAISRNPREVFLIEGHTDAVGSDVDNLSLSDRRAEAVAQALTDSFNVPPENLTTQGYGEQYLKVPTQEPERANRRSTIRRITPLLAGANQVPPPPPPGAAPPRR
ncbi:OmpA family protein [Afipia sp. P52-10]|uniref:OmpA family protein n=1 Tax=Afipia sp. P52-10 TaxID=1429916 RepID=UPI0026D1A027